MSELDSKATGKFAIAQSCAVSQKLIVCILPKDQGMPLVTLLAKQEGLTSVDVHYARGIGRITPKHIPSRADSREKEVVTVMVPCDLADEFFQLIYRVAGIGEPHGGLMYMHGLQAAIPQLLPELSEEQ